MKNLFLIQIWLILGNLSFAQDDPEALMKNVNLANIMELSERLTKAKYANSYTFDTQISVQVGHAEQQTQMNFSFGTDVLMTQMDAASNLNIIHDYNNKAMVTIDEAEKTIFALPLDFMEDMISGLQEEDDTPSDFIKTGRNKTILGYRAEEYIAEDDVVKIHFWFSKEVPIDNSSMLKEMEKSGMVFAFNVAAMQNEKYKNGIVMEMTATEKTNQTTTKMKVVGIETERKSSLNTQKYNRIDMN